MNHRTFGRKDLAALTEPIIDVPGMIGFIRELVQVRSVAETGESAAAGLVTGGTGPAGPGSAG